MPSESFREKAFLFEWVPGLLLYSWRVGTWFLLELVVSLLPHPHTHIFSQKPGLEFWS